MTPREIERLIVETGGHLCGRITHRVDGSIALMESRKLSLLSSAGVIALASIAIVDASAQTPTTSAVVSGRIVASPDYLLGQAILITLSRDGRPVAQGLTRPDHSWTLEVVPGSYDITVNDPLNHGTAHVTNATLHAGEQSLGDMTLMPQELTTTVEGEIGIHYTVGARLRHPLQYISYLRHRYL